MFTIKKKIILSNFLAGAQEISATGSRLSDISSLMRKSVQSIGDEIDLFRS